MRLIVTAVEHRDGDESGQNIAMLCACAVSGHTSKQKMASSTSESARVHELLPLEGSVSPVWKQFGFTAGNIVNHVCFQKM